MCCDGFQGLEFRVSKFRSLRTSLAAPTPEEYTYASFKRREEGPLPEVLAA